MANKTAMQDFLIHIREKRNILTRDYQNGRADYYVVRIFEMLEAEAFRRLENEKEQIKDAYLEASKQTCWSYGEEPPSDDNIYAEDYYNKTYANDTTTGLPEEDSKRRGWHY